MEPLDYILQKDGKTVFRARILEVDGEMKADIQHFNSETGRPSHQPFRLPLEEAATRFSSLASYFREEAERLARKEA